MELHIASPHLRIPEHLVNMLKERNGTLLFNGTIVHQSS